MSTILPRRAASVALATLLSFPGAPALARDCTLTTIGVVPINDLGSSPYAAGEVGGLYPNGASIRPAAHEAAGLLVVGQYVLSRDAQGNVVGQGGKVGMVSIGMSNTSQEFDGGAHTFRPRANADPTKSPDLVIVNGAQGGKPASAWVDPNATVWTTLDQRLANANLSGAQVQVAWIKQAEAGPANLGPFPAHAQVLQSDLEAIARNLRARYPNLRVCYLSSRTRAYTDVTNALNPEPFSYESAFAVRWMIEKQLAGDPSLDFDPATGNAPWLSWGPYLWADGEVPRSDGFQWLCSDTDGDFTHPSTGGETKVADMLLAFFKTDPTAVPWFLDPTPTGSAPTLAPTADVTSGPAPLTVQFAANASDADGVVTQVAWTFDDGCFSFAADPVKTFHEPGVYEVPVTASDDAGDWTRAVVTVTVTGGAATQLLPAVADAYLRDGSMAGSNFGSASELFVRGAPGTGNARSILRFDVSGVSAPVTSARLRLRLAGLAGSGALPVVARAVADDAWTEAGITWSNAPAFGVQLDEVSVGSLGDVEFDVTTFVEAERVGDGLVSVGLIDESIAQRVATFDSREAAVPPVLELQLGAPCVAAGSTPYGAGAPGLLGVPTLDVDVPPALGQMVTLSVGNAAGAPTTALLVIGLASVDVPGFWGGSLLASPDLVVTLPVVPPAGLPLTGVISADAVLCGAELFLQAIEADPGVPSGASSTRGLRLTIGS